MQHNIASRETISLHVYIFKFLALILKHIKLKLIQRCGMFDFDERDQTCLAKIWDSN